MSDLTAYREKVKNYGMQANQAEQDKNYEQAYEYYTKALDIFIHMIKCKKEQLTYLQMRRTQSWWRFTSKKWESTQREQSTSKRQF